MSICPNCGKRVKGDNKKKKGGIWRHKKCNKEARKVYQKRNKKGFTFRNNRSIIFIHS